MISYKRLVMLTKKKNWSLIFPSRWCASPEPILRARGFWHVVLQTWHVVTRCRIVGGSPALSKCALSDGRGGREGGEGGKRLGAAQESWFVKSATAEHTGSVLPGSAPVSSLYSGRRRRRRDARRWIGNVAPRRGRPQASGRARCSVTE